MRFHYVDAGLRADVGHHASFCRSICEALSRRNVDYQVYCSRAVDPHIQSEFHAIPCLTANTYAYTDGDPLSGWLNTFTQVDALTFADLASGVNVEAEDIVFLSFVAPGHLSAAIRWFRSLGKGRQPRVFAELLSDTGVDISHDPRNDRTELQLRDYRVDPKAMFWRYAAKALAADDQERFSLHAFEPLLARAFGFVTAKPCTALPVPVAAAPSSTPRERADSLTVSFLGHQRIDKGFLLVPAITESLLRNFEHIRVLIHNAAPAELHDAQQQLRRLAAQDARVVLNETPANDVLWNRLLAESDLVVCPYDPGVFTARCSAVACDAISRGIPLVVPANTSLSRLSDRFGSASTAFEKQDVATVYDAISRALQSFQSLKASAEQAVKKWDCEMGPLALVDHFLARGGTS